MTIPAKSVPKSRFMASAPKKGSVNDNKPGMHPGHEMSDLDGVPCQPAAEAVIHYTRFALIDSFPQHAKDDRQSDSDVPSMDASPEQQPKSAVHGKKRVTLACVGSIIFHSALIAAILIGLTVSPQEPIEEAGDIVSVIMIGDSDADQASAGQEAEELQPQEITAESVQPDIVQPTEVQPTDVQPTQAESIQSQTIEPQAVLPEIAEAVVAEPTPPTEPVQQISPETIVSTQPDVLTSTVPAETSVEQAMATVMPESTDTIQPEEVVPLQPKEVAPVEPTETAQALPEPPPEEAVTPVAKPQPPKAVEKPKDVAKKQPPKKVKVQVKVQVQVQAGSQGQNKQDSTKGSSEGTETAQTNQDSTGVGRKTGSGSAAVANYPGKVQSRIRRSVRVPSEYKRMSASMSVRVRLTIGSGGSISGLSVARSSGIPELDQAVVDGVRRAAPFPALPPEWGKSSWSFTQEVQVTGR